MKKILIAVIVVLVLLAVGTQVARVAILNKSALESIDATQLTAKIEKITEKNIEVEADVLQNSSYNSIASRAATLGFQENKEIVSVYDPQPISLAR